MSSLVVLLPEARGLNGFSLLGGGKVHVLPKCVLPRLFEAPGSAGFLDRKATMVGIVMTELVHTQDHVLDGSRAKCVEDFSLPLPRDQLLDVRRREAGIERVAAVDVVDGRIVDKGVRHQRRHGVAELLLGIVGVTLGRLGRRIIGWGVAKLRLKEASEQVALNPQAVMLLGSEVHLQRASQAHPLVGRRSPARVAEELRGHIAAALTAMPFLTHLRPVMVFIDSVSLVKGQEELVVKRLLHVWRQRLAAPMPTCVQPGGQRVDEDPHRSRLHGDAVEKLTKRLSLGDQVNPHGVCF